MDRDMSVGDLVSLLKQEIAERQKLVEQLRARLGETSTPRKSGVAAEAVEILRSAGRPMHGLREILPELQRRGFVPGSRAGFATALLRTGNVIRTAPGTFAYR